ncbi:MAG: type II toxin-antitoxin system prevent-host-death family antitoxin [Actinomycetota bacterium]|nr:type II toxin-antitoxin system prevent-host-death family antitoxin [Actinomycetota bacterium]
MNVTVNIHEAKTNLSRLIEDVLAGKSVTIAKAGKPLVDLVLHHEPQIVFGTLKGQLAYDDETFDEPDPVIARMFYGDI